LGRVEYADGLSLMEAFHSARLAGHIPDTLLLLEHSPVLTLGRKGSRSDVLLSEAALAAAGLEVFETNRGGEVTYHGPGQVVGYPILDLAPDRRDVRRYVHDLEEVLIRTIADAGLVAGRVEGLIGVWLAPDAVPPTPGPSRKLGAIGVHLSRWVTSHGFALNVAPDLSAFDGIVACGIRDRGVTSLAKELGREPALEEVERNLAVHASAVFDRSLEVGSAFERIVQVQIVRAGPHGPELLALRRSRERGGFWQPVTGHVEPGEDAGAAASRELLEETGLEATVLELDYTHALLAPSAAAPRVAQELTFVATAPAGFEPVLSPEHDAFAWCSEAEARSLFPFAGLRRAATLASRRLAREAA
jgi:lipoyl(octanoyl) transferase